MPGGFGAAKNLSTFGVSQEPAVDPDLERVLGDVRRAGKPLGLCCISPILAAMVSGTRPVPARTYFATLRDARLF